ncbi:MAG TPA: hypothetical protein VKB22_08545 [Gemmatimonadales bacterium]|nr:hypothetical protein [Gemmatimonadales bacterium]
MTYSLHLNRRPARFRASLIALAAISFAACDSTDQITSSTPEQPVVPAAVEPAADPTALTLEDTLGATDPTDPTGGKPIYDDEDDPVEEDNGPFDFSAPSAIAAAPGMSNLLLNYRGGMPMGVTQMPKTLYGRYTGALSAPSRDALLNYLEAARRSGTRVMLALVGNERYYKDSQGHFSFTKWKERMDRFKGLNLTPYITDGTIIGHRMIDEPHDPSNWNGTTVSRQTLDAMAKYSKSRWPGMATIVRSWPAYLKGYSYHYLDGGWAQYAVRFGSVSNFLNTNVNYAKAAGLSLTVGLNQLAGQKTGGLRGYYTGYGSLTATQLKTLGSALMNSSYPCAFLNWRYDSDYMARSDIKAALSALATKARSKAFKTCRS